MTMGEVCGVIVYISMYLIAQIFIHWEDLLISVNMLVMVGPMMCGLIVNLYYVLQLPFVACWSC